MARAADIELHPWEPYATVAARVVRARTEQLFAEAENVLDTSDIERVHDMRVASRRLRAVLEIFSPCFPAGEYKGVLKDVKRLADALGTRRDPDVHIASWQGFAEAVPEPQRPGLVSLVESMREEQARGNHTLAAELVRAEETDLHGRLLRLAAEADWLAERAGTQR